MFLAQERRTMNGKWGSGKDVFAREVRNLGGVWGMLPQRVLLVYSGAGLVLMN